MARVNRPKDEQLCLLSERTTKSEKVIWLNMHLCLLFEKNNCTLIVLSYGYIICLTAQV